MLDFQQEAFLMGQQTKVQHIDKKCVVGGLILIQLSWDYAALTFCRERLHTDLVDVHSRMALRAAAFRQGYSQLQTEKKQDPPSPSIIITQSQKAMHRRSRKRKEQIRKIRR